MATMTLYSAKKEKTTFEVENPKLDFIGDIHGCHDELMKMLSLLGYENGIHPEDRKLVFLGDITDRGPKNLKSFEEVYNLHKQGHIWLMGNHDNKLFRYLKGNRITVAHGLSKTIEEMEHTSYKNEEFASRMLKELPWKLKLVGEEEDLYAAHAYPTGKNKDACIYGPLDNMMDRDSWWHRKYNFDKPQVQVFGHYWEDLMVQTPNDTKYCIDGSCVDDGDLVCLRYPEKELTRVKSSNKLGYGDF